MDGNHDIILKLPERAVLDMGTEIFRDAKIYSPEVVAETGKALLRREVEKIKSGDIRYFTEQALLKVDPKFWIAPASFTGKHHPPEDQGPGGLVRHVAKAVVVCCEFGRRAGFSELEMDMALSATILHDICKNGRPWSDRTDYTHGLIGSRWLKQFELENSSVKEMILNAVRYHMAPWCYAVNPFEDRVYSREEMLKNWEEVTRALLCPTRIEVAVREADYWSSRKEISFLPGRTIAYDSRRHDSPKRVVELPPIFKSR